MSIFAALSLLAFSSPATDIAHDPQPSAVVGGQLAPACGWPSAVQLATNAGDPFCTGSLVDSRTVLTAAHCIDPALSSYSPDQVMFGESAFAAQSATPIANCAIHPDWDPGTGQPGSSFFYDVAVCTLAADAPDVPIVPPLMGCEADILVPGQPMTIVGYGIDNESQNSGAGIKRWTTQTIQSVNLGTGDLTLLGAGGSSACFGDSGGPVYVQLPDGSWRVAGVASTAHPDTWGQPLLCGYGVVYDLVHTRMPWFEGQTGRDLTPCHDADGTWNPDERCDQIPMQLTPAGVGWPGQCQGGQVSGPGGSCGAPYEEPSDTGGDGGTSGGEPPLPGGTYGDDDDGFDSGDDEDEEPTGGMDTGGDDEDDEPTGGTMDDEMSGGFPGWPQGGRRPGVEGCACRTRSSGGGGMPLALLALGLGLARRRRRS